MYDRLLDIKEAKLHRGIIDEYKQNDITASMMIKSLESTPPIEMEDIDKTLVENNKNFKKIFDKNNFTKMDLFRGFASQIFWNYAHKNYQEYKTYVTDNNIQAKKYNPNKANYADYKTPIDLMKKSYIEQEIKEIFNTIFKDDTIKQIRTSKVEPKTLALYDFILIPTIKSIDKLEKRFYELIKNEVAPVEIQEFMQQTLKEHIEDATLYDLCCKLRPIFY